MEKYSVSKCFLQQPAADREGRRLAAPPSRLSSVLQIYVTIFRSHRIRKSLALRPLAQAAFRSKAHYLCTSMPFFSLYLVQNAAEDFDHFLVAGMRFLQ